MLIGAQSGRRCLQSQARLAAAAGANQAQQPAGRVGQNLRNLGQFALSPDKGRQLGRKVVRGEDIGRRQLAAIPDALIECSGLGLRRDIQLCLECATAGLVLGQGRIALPVEGQHAHQLPLGGFIPRGQFYLAPGIPTGTLILAPLCKVDDQSMQGDQCPAEKLLPREQRPILKRCAAAQVQAVQKAPPVQRDRFCPLLRSLGPVASWPVCALLAGRRPVLEGLHVEPAVARAVELDRLAADQEKGRVGIAIANRSAQAG